MFKATPMLGEITEIALPYHMVPSVFDPYTTRILHRLQREPTKPAPVIRVYSFNAGLPKSLLPQREY